VKAAPRGRQAVEAVVIGGSAGAIAALGELLPKLPAAFPPVLVVVHVLASAPSLLAELFAPRCALRVVEAEAFMPIERGSVYFAPSDYHLLATRDRRCALSIGPPVNFSRPSIDVLFDSAAAAFGAGLVGVVLTGASHDGAQGAALIARAGGRTLVQSPSTTEAPQMPAAALAAVPSAREVPLGAIASELVAMVEAS
jgi:two-component system chemotaxis response regulator CheB